MKKFLALSLISALCGGSAMGACSGCSTLEPEPTLENGDCKNTSFNCKVWPRYVCDTTRLVNRNDCTEYFKTKAGTWTIYNSSGVALGSFTSDGTTKIRINVGIRAVATNLGMVMCFSKWTSSGTFTGWLTTEALAESTTGNYDTMPENPGGDVSLWHSVQSDNSIYLDGDGNSFKVTRNCDTAGENATDYLTRPNGNNNMVYNLPGTGYGSPTENVRPYWGAYNFYRYKNVTSVDRDLWNCRTQSYSARKLKFLYGRQYEKHTARDGTTVIKSRRGWVAIDCLDPGVGASDY